jgi:excisionase family DNA binding protein
MQQETIAQNQLFADGDIQFLMKQLEQLNEILSQKILPKKAVFNSKEAAAYLGISMSWLDKLCSNRLIKFSRMGRLRRFTIKSLNEYLLGNEIKTDAEIDDEAELLLMRRSRGVNAKNR